MNLFINFLKSKELRNLFLYLSAVIAVVLLIRSNRQLGQDNKRLAVNMQSLTAELKYVKTQNGNLAAQTDVLLLRTSELKALFPKEAKAIKDMGVKVSSATQVSSTVVETQKNIVTVVRDSVIHDTIRVKVFDYKDQWYQISGINQGDVQRLQIHTTDTLTQVVYKGERIHPWLWIFSKRKLQQRVSVSNPNATIKYSQFIQIQQP